MNTVIMLLITAFLGGLLLFRDEKGRVSRFFDLEATGTLRGFWCLIVMLVHVPEAHQNAIQDMLGSFAYIGVSFFFMASGYGLVLAVRKNPHALAGFWKRRLPKLLIPMLAVNLLTVAAESLMGGGTIWTLVRITGFVRQLLLFYFLFWVVFSLPAPGLGQKDREWLLCGCAAAISLLIYVTEGMKLFSWPVESLGFLYGVLLARYAPVFQEKMSSRWLAKCAVSCVSALLLGALYLKAKHVIFWGDYLLKTLLGVGILLFVLCVNARYALGNPLGRFLGGISYEVYLVHGLVFQCVDYAAGGLESGSYILICMVLTVLLSAAVHAVSKRILRLIK